MKNMSDFFYIFFSIVKIHHECILEAKVDYDHPLPNSLDFPKKRPVQGV